MSKGHPDTADVPSGRGATSNRTGRFEHVRIEEFDDGWAVSSGEEPSARNGPCRSDAVPVGKVATIVTAEATRRAITTNDSPDVPFDRSINPYKGCEHGCVYCFARPTHAFLGLSPGLDFETRIVTKPDAAERLRRELERPGYRPETIALGANTDPYQPVERELGITRSILEVMAEARHPVSIITKSALVLRDLDLLAEMAKRRLAHVYVSITTLEPELARRMEPRAATPARRLETLRALTDAGVPTGVLASPMIPALNDWELERILEAASMAGATSAGYLLVRLPGEVADLFREWLHANYPDRTDHVLARIRDTRAGKLYRGGFGERMRGTGRYAELLQARFEAARARLGLAKWPSTLDTSNVRRSRQGDVQLGLFDTSERRTSPSRRRT